MKLCVFGTGAVGGYLAARLLSLQGADSADALLHDADSACYLAKRLGRGRVVVYGSPSG